MTVGATDTVIVVMAEPDAGTSGCDNGDGVPWVENMPEKMTIAMAAIATSAPARRSFFLSRRLWFSRTFFLYRPGK
jgi:hypothetical protein